MRSTTRRGISSSSSSPHKRIVVVVLLVIVGVFVHLRVGVQTTSGDASSHPQRTQPPSMLSDDHASVTSMQTEESVSSTSAGFPSIPTAQLPVVIAKDLPVRDHSNLPTILVVVGIPTTDTPFGQQRRQWQRGSWLRYRSIWRHDRGECGAAGEPLHQSCIVVKYLIGRHPSHDYHFSNELVKESERNFGDMIGLEMSEGAPSTGKRSGGAGYWGLEAEVGMSRKALLWYRAALDLFPQALYIMKCDDDVFLRVPQYVHDLNALHSTIVASGSSGMLYWGKVMKWGAVKGDPSSKFYFVGGMSITMSRGLAQRITEHAPIQEHALQPFPTAPLALVGGGSAPPSSPDLAVAKMYKEHNMDHEDVMIGRIVYNLKLNVTMVKDCRYHDVHKGANVQAITPRSVAIHHLNEDEYVQLFKRFGEDAVEKTAWRLTTGRSFHVAYSPC
jgi:hypothetical protein